VRGGIELRRCFVAHMAPVREASDHRPLVAVLRGLD